MVHLIFISITIVNIYVLFVMIVFIFSIVSRLFVIIVFIFPMIVNQLHLNHAVEISEPFVTTGSLQATACNHYSYYHLQDHSQHYQDHS